MRLQLRALRTYGSALALAGALFAGPAAAGPAAAANPPAGALQTQAPRIAAARIGTLCRSALPGEADGTLALIAQGGPFPFGKDGEVFRNYERTLPAEPDGYYHAYTVITPGSATRGPRRIVTAGDGTDYYTGDHYRSFSAIDFGC